MGLNGRRFAFIEEELKTFSSPLWGFLSKYLKSLDRFFSYLPSEVNLWSCNYRYLQRQMVVCSRLSRDTFFELSLTWGIDSFQKVIMLCILTAGYRINRWLVIVTLPRSPKLSSRQSLGYDRGSQYCLRLRIGSLSIPPKLLLFSAKYPSTEP